MGRDQEARLYVVVAAGIAPAAVGTLPASAPIAALLIAADGSPLDAGRTKPLVELVQARAIAALPPQA